MLTRLDEARQKIESLLACIDPSNQIYTGWTLKELLAHMTGWDLVAIDSLRALLNNQPPSMDPIQSVDLSNALAVTVRQDLDSEEILEEWRQTRLLLYKIIAQIPVERYMERFLVPWGEMITLKALIDLFSTHEEEHALDITEWLNNHCLPLGKEGK